MSDFVRQYGCSNNLALISWETLVSHAFQLRWKVERMSQGTAFKPLTTQRSEAKNRAIFS